MAPSRRVALGEAGPARDAAEFRGHGRTAQCVDLTNTDETAPDGTASGVTSSRTEICRCLHRAALRRRFRGRLPDASGPAEYCDAGDNGTPDDGCTAKARGRLDRALWSAMTTTLATARRCASGDVPTDTRTRGREAVLHAVDRRRRLSRSALRRHVSAFDPCRPANRYPLGSRIG